MSCAMPSKPDIIAVTDTYTVRFKCPFCKKGLKFEKKKNGVSPQRLRLKTFDDHRKAGECNRD